jgi:hypothetical protein
MTTPRHNLWTRWVAFLDRREPGTSLALFRIACGLILVGAVGTVVAHGLVPVIWLNPEDGGYRTVEVPWQFRLAGGVNPGTVWPAVALTLTSGLLLAAGLGGRLTALLALQSYLALSRINEQNGGSDDLLFANALWLVVLSRSTATLSLDCRLRTGRWTSAEPVPAWPRYLVIYQMVLTYWTTGVQKVSVYWTPAGGYSALYHILQQPSWQRWDMSWLAWVYPLTQAGTALSWVWEVTAPLLLLALWYRHTRERPGRLRALFNRFDYRLLFVAVGVPLHLLVFALLDVEPFTWVALSYYLCLFRPDEWGALGRRLRSWWGGRPAEAPPPAPAGRTAGWFRHLRGLLVALHLLAVTLMAFPALSDGAMDRSAWKEPTVQEELADWAERLSGWGLAVSPAELEDRLWDFAQGYTDARRKLLAPFRPYYVVCGTRQSWRMFSGPSRYLTRLHIDVEEGGVWRTVYVERDPAFPWLGVWLDHSRFRPALFDLGLDRDPEGYDQFTHWVARQAARDFPGADRVRVHFYQYRNPSPEEVREDRRPPGQFVLPVVLPLAR